MHSSSFRLATCLNVCWINLRRVLACRGKGKYKRHKDSKDFFLSFILYIFFSGSDSWEGVCACFGLCGPRVTQALRAGDIDRLLVLCGAINQIDLSTSVWGPLSDQINILTETRWLSYLPLNLPSKATCPFIYTVTEVI